MVIFTYSSEKGGVYGLIYMGELIKKDMRRRKECSVKQKKLRKKRKLRIILFVLSDKALFSEKVTAKREGEI
jgi:hypothetical protein